jgi:predicted site-specific integrase-resolvase
MSFLREFELWIGLSPSQAAKLLGCARQTYYQYRRTGEIPLPVRRHMELLMRLPREMLIELIKEHVHQNDGSDEL